MQMTILEAIHHWDHKDMTALDPLNVTMARGLFDHRETFLSLTAAPYFHMARGGVLEYLRTTKTPRVGQVLPVVLNGQLVIDSIQIFFLLLLASPISVTHQATYSVIEST